MTSEFDMTVRHQFNRDAKLVYYRDIIGYNSIKYIICDASPLQRKERPEKENGQKENRENQRSYDKREALGRRVSVPNPITSIIKPSPWLWD